MEVEYHSNTKSSYKKECGNYINIYLYIYILYLGRELLITIY